MSNPAVVKSKSIVIQGRPFYLDDNYGESIHVHFGDIRLDFSFAGMDAFLAQLDSVLEDDCFRSLADTLPHGVSGAGLRGKARSMAHNVKKQLVLKRDGVGKISYDRLDPAARALIENR